MAPMERYTVRTDGTFSDGKTEWVVYAEKYRVKIVRFRNGNCDALYDMDRIYRCGGQWYDMKGEMIPGDMVQPKPEDWDNVSIQGGDDGDASSEQVSAEAAVEEA